MIIEYIEFWILLSIIFLLIEVLTRKLYFISITIGIISVIILNLLKYPIHTQLISLLIVTIICIIITRPIAHKIKKSHEKKFEVNELIGGDAIVNDYLNKNIIGTIQYEGKNWQAISNEELLEGSLVTIVGVDGRKLVVEKKL